MTPRDEIVALLAQTLAPRLFAIFGVRPEEMGFPIYKTKEEVEVHLARQFKPVHYWISEGEKIAQSVLNVLEAGGIDCSKTPVTDAMCQAAGRERPDVQDGVNVGI